MQKVNMSDSCFEHSQLNKCKPKLKGTLQFGHSADVKLVSQVKKSWAVNERNFIGDTRSNDVLLKFGSQIPRVPSGTMLNKKLTKEEKRVFNKLPSHMHTINNSLRMGNTLERTLRETKHQHAGYLEPDSSFKYHSFRHDPHNETPKAFDP